MAPFTPESFVSPPRLRLITRAPFATAQAIPDATPVVVPAPLLLSTLIGIS
jgi:hypothetical protein